jgi:hypothetical protein
MWTVLLQNDLTGELLLAKIPKTEASDEFAAARAAAVTTEAGSPGWNIVLILDGTYSFGASAEGTSVMAPSETSRGEPTSCAVEDLPDALS